MESREETIAKRRMEMELSYSEAITKFKSLPVEKQIELITSFMKFSMYLRYFALLFKS